jgi:hypothetical protein
VVRVVVVPDGLGQNLAWLEESGRILRFTDSPAWSALAFYLDCALDELGPVENEITFTVSDWVG